MSKFQVGQRVRLKDEVYEKVKRQRTNGKGIIYNGRHVNVPFKLIKEKREGNYSTIERVVDFGHMNAYYISEYTSVSEDILVGINEELEQAEEL